MPPLQGQEAQGVQILDDPLQPQPMSAWRREQVVEWFERELVEGRRVFVCPPRGSTKDAWIDHTRAVAAAMATGKQVVIVSQARVHEDRISVALKNPPHWWTASSTEAP